jgi:S1-C subfamily serine protease
VVLRAEEKGTEEENPAASKLSSGAPSAASAVACVPTGFKGGVVRLNTELLQGASMQPEVFYPLLEARDGSLVVRTDNGHAAMLGLRAGDVLQSANSIALTRAEDVSATILKPLTAGQSVLLKGKRGDQARELLLVNASVCRG